MSVLRWRSLFLASFIVAAAALFYRGPQAEPGLGGSLRLAAPAFVHEAAAETALDIGAELASEAGISAYFLSPDPINLTSVQSAFRTIETQTTDYIIGSVPITNEWEHFDAHVYVHRDGWILAYYLKDEPISKCINIRGATIDTTHLTTALGTVASAAGVPFTGETYYDWRYPNATHLLLVAEDAASGLDFTITLPTEFGYYERSYAAGDSHIYLDGVELAPLWYANGTEYGYLTASQLSAGTPHVFSMHLWANYGVLAIAYRVP